jgi:hypothetical protein
MEAAKVVSRSNSDLLAIKMIADNTNLSAAARMEAIAEYAAAWHRVTRLAPGDRSIATREYERAKTSRRLFN